MSLLIWSDPEHARHDPPGRPDSPARVDACLGALGGVPHERRGARQATLEELMLVHSREYLKALEQLCREGGGRIDRDTLATEGTFDVARSAAGQAIDAVSETKRGHRSFCLTRPPGHHASHAAAMGFCFVNHAAVAARWAIESAIAKRVAIVDIDVHHGNGTQETFYSDPDVLYISLHQWPWYPGTGAVDETGDGDGDGTTLNIPLPATSGDQEYLRVMDALVLPALVSFEPDLLLISAGFDAHINDPLGAQTVSANGFEAMAARLVRVGEDVCDGRVVAMLEGGYNQAALGESFARFARVLAGGASLMDQASLTTSAIPTYLGVDRVIEFHSRRTGTSTAG